MTLLELNELLRGAVIDDVLVTGFVDRSELPARFHALLGSFVLDCGVVLLRFSAVPYSGRGVLAPVAAVTPDSDLDDDLEPALSSLSELLIDDPNGSNRINSVTLWGAAEAAAGIECSAVRFDLANGQVLFFDPSYHFGIKCGNAAQQSIWVANSGERDAVVCLSCE